FLSVIDQNHPHLAAVARVDRAGRVQQRDAVAQRQPAARPHLPLIARRYLQYQAGTDGAPGPRRETQLFDSAEVHAGILVRGVRATGQLRLRVNGGDGDGDGAHGSSLPVGINVINSTTGSGQPEYVSGLLKPYP